MEGCHCCQEKIPSSRVVLGHLCTGKCKLLDGFEQASEIKCLQFVTKNNKMIQKLSLLAVHLRQSVTLTVLNGLKVKTKYQPPLLKFIQVNNLFRWQPMAGQQNLT